MNGEVLICEVCVFTVKKQKAAVEIALGSAKGKWVKENTHLSKELINMVPVPSISQ